MKHIKPWKKINSTILLDSEHLCVSKDMVILPNGKKKSYLRHTAGQPNSVIVIAVNDKKEVLIQREYSYPPNKVMWQLPGGSVEHKEDIIVAANRELAEESGYVGKSSCIIGYFYTSNRISDQMQYVVLCTKLIAFKLPENEDEFIETYWMTRREIKQKIADNKFNNINLLAALNMWFQYPKKAKTS